jgi:hypothetical protein
MPMEADQGSGFVTTNLEREPHRRPHFVGLMMMAVNRRRILALRIASSANVTLVAQLAPGGGAGARAPRVASPPMRRRLARYSPSSYVRKRMWGVGRGFWGDSNTREGRPPTCAPAAVQETGVGARNGGSFLRSAAM